MTISLLFLATINPASTLSGCTVTLINIKSKDLQVFCDSEHSKLTEIPKDLKPYTKTLSFSMQNITKLESNEFKNVIDLRKLIIKSSHLTSVDILAFKGLNHLEWLNLRNNSLTINPLSLPKESFKYLNSLKFLDLSQNPIAFIPDFYFQHLGFTLTSLFLSDLSKKITLSLHSLYGLKELDYLDLTFNKLQTIQQTVLGSIIDRSTFNATTVLLAGNFWYCDCRLRWIREWYFDNVNRVSVNLIEEIRPGLRNTLRPYCHNPLHMRGTYLFPQRSSTVSIQEMKCPERSLTNSSSVIAQENSNITLLCTFIVDSMENYKSRVVWTHNGYDISSKSQLDLVIKTNIDNFKLFSHLTLIHVRVVYQGTWQCRLNVVEDLKPVFTDFYVSIKVDDFIKLSNRSKKLLIYISISLLTFLLIVFGVGLIFYLCFRCHRNSADGIGKRKQISRLGIKEIRPKSVDSQQNHFLLYDDCDVQTRKPLKQYEPYNFSCEIQCGCKECLGSTKQDSLDNDSKSLSLCPVHGLCTVPLKDIVPNDDGKKPCPVHGGSTIEGMITDIGPVHYKTLPTRKSKKSVTMKDIPNDIVLSTLGINKRVHLNCPVHGEVLSLNRSQ